MNSEAEGSELGKRDGRTEAPRMGPNGVRAGGQWSSRGKMVTLGPSGSPRARPASVRLRRRAWQAGERWMGLGQVQEVALRGAGRGRGPRATAIGEAGTGR